MNQNRLRTMIKLPIYGWIFAALLAVLFAPLSGLGQDAPVESESSARLIADAADEAMTKAPKPIYSFNDQIYYRHKLELSLEVGDLFENIPFVFDVFVGGDYKHQPYHYTLIPIFPSLRWQVSKINGPLFLRGNTELTASFNITAIPRGYESIYGAFDLGFRRNFVYRNWKASPYFEGGAGAGFIDAQEPGGNATYAQGQDFTFTLSLGAGVRYNLSTRYAVSLGGRYMHVSNAYLSEPKYDDNGINVVGPWVGVYMRLGKGRHGE